MGILIFANILGKVSNEFYLVCILTHTMKTVVYMSHVTNFFFTACQPNISNAQGLYECFRSTDTRATSSQLVKFLTVIITNFRCRYEKSLTDWEDH